MRALLGMALVACLGACGGTTTAKPATTATTASRTTRQVSHGQGFDLVITATSCWMGGLWADALGEKYDARTTGIDARCNEVLQAMEASSDVAAPLRAVDVATVTNLAQTVRVTAQKDPIDAPYAADLETFLGRIADATRESIRARRAADQVKEDAKQTPVPPSYAADKDAAATSLSQGDAMRALLEQRGPYASEARTIGLFVALDRMEIARGLTKRLKIDVVGPSYDAVFGVAQPTVLGNGADRSPPGVWLTYLTEVARAARHPVPTDAVALPDRETDAWSGVLAGFADQLRAQQSYAEPQTQLGQAVRDVVAQLDKEFATIESLNRAKQHR